MFVVAFLVTMVGTRSSQQTYEDFDEEAYFDMMVQRASKLGFDDEKLLNYAQAKTEE